MQNLTQPTLLLKPFAENGQRNSIPKNATGTNLASLDEGFPPVTGQNPRDGGIPPTRLDFNGLGHLTTTYDYFYQAGGCFTFNQVVSDAIGGYPLNARLWYLNENGESSVLRSTKNNNTDNFLNDPSVIGDSWVYDVATTTYVKDEINEIRTNCITEIPQDIKLELADGTLTLKAGSVITFPDGTQYQTTTDRTFYGSSGASDNQVRLVYYNYTANNLLAVVGNQSGATPPTESTGNVVFYNTSDKTIRLYSNGVINNNVLSFPIAVVKAGNSLLVNTLEQVFNGFGYIGSTVFALPGVKGLCPNGRNEDGTLNNISFTISNVTLRNFTFAISNLCFRPSNGSFGNLTNSYNETDNLLTVSGTDRWLNIGTVLADTSSPYNIISFTPKTPFHAVDYNDFVDLEEKVDTKQDIATAVNYDNITNCITDIPQDIKLELNNGTLTLKAGSKVYVPNGAGEFGVVNITSDRTALSGSVSGTYVICAATTHLDWYKIENVFSGASAPSGFSLSGLWYDTTNNVLKRSTDGGATWTQSNASLPIAIVSANNGFSSIDQIFNGFGYIGSTVFALPGVKGLISNGRNEDGSLKNIEFTLSSVKTNTRTNDTANTLVLSGNDISQQRFPNSWNYDAEKNIVYSVAQNAQRNYCVVGEVSSESTKITSFQPKNTFRAVDYFDAVKYSDKAEVVSWSKPDLSRAVTKSSQASGSAYTSSVTGIVVVSILEQNLARDDVLDVRNETTGERFITHIGEWADAYDSLAITVRVWKGDVYYINYANNRTLTITEIPFGGV